MKKTIIIATAVVLLMLSGCAKEKKEEEKPPVFGVQVDKVEHEPIQRVIIAEGVLRALEQSAVTPKISAPVLKFFVNKGSAVTAGQVLATLESKDLEAAVVDTRAAYAQAEANFRNVSKAAVPEGMVKSLADVQSAQQGLDAAKRLVDSREKLYKDGALPRRQVDEALVLYAQAKAQFDTANKHLESVQGVSRVEDVNIARAQADSAKGKMDAARAQLSYAEVHSPISGIVSERMLFPGEMAQAGTPLLNVMDVSNVIARVSIPQAQAGFVHVGQAAKVVASDGTAAADGKITVISPAVDPQATTLEVWVQMSNPGGRLKPGGTVKVTIQCDTLKDALVVPTVALLPHEDGSTAVYVVNKENLIHVHKVQTGIRNADKTQIVSGVQEGDVVVVEGGVGLGDGAKVKIEKPGEGEKKDDEKGKKDDDHKEDEKKK